LSFFSFSAVFVFTFSLLHFPSINKFCHSSKFLCTINRPKARPITAYLPRP
jgi:hypothetical protein